jgi:hypothetical protein
LISFNDLSKEYLQIALNEQYPKGVQKNKFLACELSFLSSNGYYVIIDLSFFSIEKENYLGQY